MAVTLPLRERFYAGYVRFEPEDATSLGEHETAEFLGDPSEAGLSDEVRFYQAILAELASETADLSPTDRWAIEAYATFRCRYLAERRENETNFEASLYPNGMLGHLVAHADGPAATRAIEARISQIPRYLAALEDGYRRGRTRGRRPDIALATHFSGDLLPAATKHLQGLGEVLSERGLVPSDERAFNEGVAKAVAATQAHKAFFEAELLPHAEDAYAIGEEEYALRLSGFFGIHESTADLIAWGEEELRGARALILEGARAVAEKRGGVVRDFSDASKLFMALYGERPASTQAVVELYRSLEDRVRAFARDGQVYTIPAEFDLGYCPIPPGMVFGTTATNWPAPVKDPTQKAHVAYAKDPAMHSIPGSANLYVHEGLPGHSLQSLAWQRLFAQRGAPVPFIAVCDDVAIARQYFGPMLMVEGWAVRAEERLWEKGFFTPEEALLSVVSRAIRAARVVMDVGLHTGRLTTEQAVVCMAEEAGMGERFAQGQVLRYKRIPLQAITYALGSRELDRAWRRWQALEGTSEAAFHERALSWGTAPCGLLQGA